MTHIESGEHCESDCRLLAAYFRQRYEDICAPVLWWSAVCLIKALICRAQTHIFAPSCVCLKCLCAYSLPLCTCMVLWFSDKVIRLPVSAESQSVCSVSASCSPLDVVSDRIQSLDSNLPPFLHWETLLAHHVHEIECSRHWVTETPPVTWINSCMYDGALAVAKGTSQSTPHTLHHSPLQLPPLPHYSPPSGLLHEAHSSVQCWNMAGSTDIWWHLCPLSTHQVYRDLSQQKDRGGWAEWWWWRWVGERDGQPIWCYEKKCALQFFVEVIVFYGSQHRSR